MMTGILTRHNAFLRRLLTIDLKVCDFRFLTTEAKALGKFVASRS